MKDFQHKNSKPEFRNSEPNKKDDFIFGLHPVMEAIEAGKTIDKIFLQNALQGENMAELKKLLAQHNIRANYVPIEKLNRFTRKNHQGVVAFISDVPFYKIENDQMGQVCLYEDHQSKAGSGPDRSLLHRLWPIRPHPPD